MELKLEKINEFSYGAPGTERIMEMNTVELDALEKKIKQKLDVKRAEYENLKLRI
jgi:hypothetical protein